MCIEWEAVLTHAVFVCRVSAMCIEWEAVLTHAVFVCRVWLCVLSGRRS